MNDAPRSEPPSGSNASARPAPTARGSPRPPGRTRRRRTIIVSVVGGAAFLVAVALAAVWGNAWLERQRLLEWLEGTWYGGVDGRIVELQFEPGSDRVMFRNRRGEGPRPLVFAVEADVMVVDGVRYRLEVVGDDAFSLHPRTGFPTVYSRASAR